MHGGGHERGMRSGTLERLTKLWVWVKPLSLPAKTWKLDGLAYVYFATSFGMVYKVLQQVFIKRRIQTQNVANYLNVSFNFVEGES